MVEVDEAGLELLDIHDQLHIRGGASGARAQPVHALSERDDLGLDLVAQAGVHARDALLRDRRELLDVVGIQSRTPG